jgi:hypothetical protein
MRARKERKGDKIKNVGKTKKLRKKAIERIDGRLVKRGKSEGQGRLKTKKGDEKYRKSEGEGNKETELMKETESRDRQQSGKSSGHSLFIRKHHDVELTDCEWWVGCEGKKL